MWTSKDIQEEIIDLMYCDVVRNFAKQTRYQKYFGIIADETADLSQVEQLSICLRTVDNELNPEEQAFGFYALGKCDGDVLLLLI